MTPAVQEWLNGSQANDGLALVANSGLVATFDSKENAAQSHPAELDVVFGSGSSIAAVNTPSGGGLTGGGDSGTLNLSLQPCSTGQVLQWNGSAWACASAATGTITGVTAGAELTGGGTSGNVTVNLDTTQVPLLNAANTFTAVQTINNQVLISATTGGYSLSVGGNASGIIGSTYTTAGYGVTGSHDATTGNGAGLYGLTFSPSGSGVLGIGGTGIEGRATICCGSGGIFTGYSVPANSGQVATYGIKATGGNGDVNDPNNQTGDGVFAQGGSGAFGGFGIRAYAGTGPIGDGIGGLFLGGNSSIHGDGILAESGSGFAGSFVGNVQVLGTLSATVKNFKIDHPLDPGNKYLVHASVESSELMNIYTGNIITDAQGEATVSMPEWFEALNTDFRYQLTVVGQFAQAIVGHKIENHQFQIKTNAPSVEVSWQVTAVRQDAYAKAHPLLVEEEKETPLKGFYIHPELYGAADEKQIEWARHPGIMQHMKDHRSKEVATAKP